MITKLKKLRDRLTDKQAKFVELVVSGMDRGEAYQKAKYKPKTLQMAQQEASRLLTQNVKVIAYYEACLAEIERKLNIQRGTQLRKLNETYDMAKEDRSTSAMVSAIREQNEMLGFHRESAPNLEREERRRDLIDKELKELSRLVADRTDELSKPVKSRIQRQHSTTDRQGADDGGDTTDSKSTKRRPVCRSIKIG